MFTSYFDWSWESWSCSLESSRIVIIFTRVCWGGGGQWPLYAFFQCWIWCIAFSYEVVKNQHFQNRCNLLWGRWSQKEYSVYALDNVDNSGRPLYGTECFRRLFLFLQSSRWSTAPVTAREGRLQITWPSASSVYSSPSCSNTIGESKSCVLTIGLTLTSTAPVQLSRASSGVHCAYWARTNERSIENLSRKN